MLQEALQGIGLDPKEAKVYLALLEIGQGGLSEIALKSKLNRTSLYPILTTLLEKKFISLSIKGRRKVYIVEPPTGIKKLLKEKVSAFDELLPGLLLVASQSPVKPVITFREGFEGIKEAFRESLRANDKVLLAFCEPNILGKHHNHALQTFWEKEYMPKRKQLGRSVRIIFPDNEMGRAYHALDGEESTRESRLLPASQYPFECEIHVYDDTVGFVSYNEHEQFVLQIKSGPIARTVKLIWQIVWKSAY